MSLCDKIWVNVVNDVRNDDVNRSRLSEADTMAIENAVAEEENVAVANMSCSMQTSWFSKFLENHDIYMARENRTLLSHVNVVF